jgi:glycosyltransferase involved in cell wall biosynthesis
LDLPPERPDIVHCHNLHGSYFDLRALPWLSQQVPTILTLHDAWLLSGHCAHSFDCERWKTGCGDCPDLTIYPAIKRDATAYNWQRKRDIYKKSRLYIATPSHWLMRKVKQSILAPAIVEARVIPYGVDLTIFHPGDRREARAALGIPQGAKMLLFVSHATRSNPWKDYATLEAAVERVAERLPDERIILVCLGEERKSGSIERAEVWFIGYRKDPATVARFYQAADIYLHAAKADTFPNTVLEAIACGTPVVATAVGGIPEQGEVGVTGFLVSPGDAQAMAESIIMILTDDTLRVRLGYSAAENAQKHFDLNRLVDDYVGWYREILENWQSKGCKQSHALPTT